MLGHLNRSIIMYHSIGDFPFSVRSETFVRQLAVMRNRRFGFVSQATDGNMGVFLTFDDGYIDNYTVLYPIIRQLNIRVSIFVATNFIGKKYDFGRSQVCEVLTSTMIQEMSKSGLVEFGSHSHTHANLLRLSDREIEYELGKSKDVLQSITGQETQTFAFPFSIYNPVVPDILTKLRYRYGVTGRRGYVPRNPNLLCLPRWGVGVDTSYLSFRLKLLGVLRLPFPVGSHK